MDAAAKNRARNRAGTKRKALDGVYFAVTHMAGVSAFRKAVLAALEANATDAEIGVEVRLATLSLAKAG